MTFNEVEYLELLKLNYEELVEYLRKKYGEPKESYFRTETRKTKNPRITRTDEGLEVHHIGEDIYPNLSDTEWALMAPWEEQLPDRLIYCNLIEHTLLHVLISEERGKAQPYFDFKAMLVNDILRDYSFKREWYKIVYEQMKDHKQILIDLYKRVGADSLIEY